MGSENASPGNGHSVQSPVYVVFIPQPAANKWTHLYVFDDKAEAKRFVEVQGGSLYERTVHGSRERRLSRMSVSSRRLAPRNPE